MRGNAFVVAGLVLAHVVTGQMPAYAQPSPTPTAEEGQAPVEAVPGEEQCAISDPRLIELSGLVATEDGYIAVNDSTEFEDRLPIFVLDQDCQVVDEIGFVPPNRPRDPEDLELDRGNNILWVADTGDNAAGGGEGEVRPSVALWRVQLDGDRVPEIYRFTYPDGEPRDAEALVLDGDGTPIIVTKGSTAELFSPEELTPSASPDDTVALAALGEFSPPETETDNPLGAAGRQVVTGGANAPDGQGVVLRTYADAFEFEVADGGVVAAITEGEPLITPLPDEPQGEAITYAADGAQFLTVSEAPEGDTEFTPTLLSYTPAEPPPPPEGEAAADEPGDSGGGGGLFGSLQDIINLIAIVGVIGLLLVAAGVFGIIRARRRGSGPSRGGEGPDGPDDAPVTGRARLTGFPGDSPSGWEEVEQPTGVYGAGAQPPGTEYGGGQYGGTEYGGTQYGGTQYGGGEYGGGEYGGDYPGGPEYGEYGPGEYGGQPYGGQQYGGTQYGGTQYGGQQYGGTQYGGAEYGGAEPGYAGTTYGRGHAEQPYDQEWHNGYHNGYHDGGYPPQAEPPPQAGTYQAGTYQAGAPDYYSDDPDYPYEFRERDRW